MIRIGLDIGSTTLKCVILNASGELLYKDYRRHFSRIAENAAAMLGEIAAAFPNERECELVVSGSAGMGIAETLGLPFVQEVYATRTAVRHYLPDCDVVIELGGEDAKILFLGEDAEGRMNGSCAGGTGAFIDQMATLLSITPDEMNYLAQSSRQTYTIASRCGVFAKSDIQPLINQGASKNDICASIFGAVVNQTVAGLAQGRPLEGKIAYLGGPLTFLSQLRASFDETLDTKGVCPENSLYYVALGAALSDEHASFDLGKLEKELRGYGGSGDYRACPPLFTSQEEYERFAARHARAAVRTDNPAPDGPFEASLGIDAGSTTVKAVVTDLNGDILYTRYQSNTGDPVAIVLAVLRDFYARFPAAKLVASCATGYGEDIVKSAFGVDFGVVEHVENALRGGKVVRARFFFGNEARQLRQVVAQKVADAERVNRRERGVNHVRGTALVVRADAGFQRFVHRGDDLHFPIVGDFKEQKLLAAEEFIERGFGNPRVRRQHIQRGLFNSGADGIFTRAFLELFADGVALLGGEGLRHGRASFVLSSRGFHPFGVRFTDYLLIVTVPFMPGSSALSLGRVMRTSK